MYAGFLAMMQNNSLDAVPDEVRQQLLALLQARLLTESDLEEVAAGLIAHLAAVSATFSPLHDHEKAPLPQWHRG